MEQIIQIIQQVYYMLSILSNYPQNKREEMVQGFDIFLGEIVDILISLNRIVEGSTYWGWKFAWGYHPWQLRTYQEQKGLTLQAGWEDRVDFDVHLYQHIPDRPSKIPVPIVPPRPLTRIDLGAEKAEDLESGILTDVCRVGYIQPERPVVFHELIPEDSGSSNEGDSRDVAHMLPVVEENDDIDGMPELEDEFDLDTVEIPLWLIPREVTITFQRGQMEFEREQGPPWQEVLTQMIAEQDAATD